MRGFFALLLLLLFAAPASATQWAIGLGAGWRTWDSKFGQSFHVDPTLQPADGVEFGGRFSVTSNHGFGAELAASWSPTELQQSGRDVAKLHASFATLNLVFDPEPKRWGAPFVGVGGGAGILYTTDPEPGFDPAWLGSDDDDAEYPGYLDVSAGWTFRLRGPVRMRLEARHLRWIGPNSGPFESSTAGSWTFGAQILLRSGGQAADADQDGVPDRSDTCPDTPQGARVDRTGCPLDADGDGVFDGLDFCPQTPSGALVDERGCGVDTDRDGVVDGLDRCPGTSRKCSVNADGCPIDSDGDGVCDAIDRCSATPRGWAVNDEGCPLDADRDGVPDGGDQCPNTLAGTRVDGNGCPLELGQMENELVTTGKVKIPIVFESGRDLLLVEHETALDRIALLLQRWPGFAFEIAATPGSGERSTPTLGERRARTVRDDLARRLPAPETVRLTARGGTGARSTASRIELVALDKAALRKEAERRGLIKPPPPPAPKPKPKAPAQPYYPRPTKPKR